MAKNPKIVVDEILNSNGTEISKEIKIFPMTIRRYSWFEKLESPFIDATKKFDINNIIPSVYVMTRTSDELKQYGTNNIEKLIEDSFDWSEELTLDDVPKMIGVVTSQMLSLNKASPDAVDAKDDGKKK